MSQSTFEILRFTHIMSGVFWTGAIVMIAFFLEPAVRVTGAAGGQVMQRLMGGQQLAIYLTLAAWLTIVAGIPVYWRISAHLNDDWIRSDPGLAYTIGGAIAILEAMLGTFVNAPLARRVGIVGAQLQQAGGPPSAEQLAGFGELQDRLRMASRFGASMLIAATAAMAMARYL